MAAVLWPSRFLGPLDGAPLDRPLEAIALGLALPWLFWLGRDVCQSRAFRAAVCALLMWKCLTAAAAGQQGLCATFQSPQPFSGIAGVIRIDEPHGLLRSWDVRADIWREEPRCTAILSRPLRATEEFPAWFVNVTDQMFSRNFTMRVQGMATDADGVSRPLDVVVPLGSEPWTFDPSLNGSSVWRSALVTTAAPSALDRWLAPWAWLTAPLLCLIIAARVLHAAIGPLLADRSAIAWVVLGSSAAAALALLPIAGVWRFAGILTLGALLVRIQRRPLHTAVWLVGAPWLTFFAASSAGLVGRFSAYSNDDWLIYQIAGYRIYMNGHWLEAGTATFDYQALYRWITGGLHLIFGDSSVGEVYWDASCLLAGALLAFSFARRAAGVRWGTVAAAVTLATFTLSTPWYIIGRGLSEISAAACGFAAIACLLRAREGDLRWGALAAAMAALMFYARINHLLWAPFLIAMLLPSETTSDLASFRAGVVRLSWKAVVVYLGGFALAVIAFMTRTWYFTGHFALFHGTALRHNDTGLRPWHVVDAEVWGKVSHSIAGLLFMNEPPRPDPRSAILVVGALVALLALLQFPIARRIPAGLLVVTIGGVLGAFVAHSHAYPGRFSVHLVPLAAALTAIAASVITSGLTGSDWRVSHNNGT